jgi:hypothetical protein
MHNRTKNHKETILEAMDSMLASAQLEAQPGITLEKFLLELEFMMEYHKAGEMGKFTKGQLNYIKRILNSHYKVREIDNKKYYIGQGILF